MKLNLDAPADEAQIQIIPLIDVIFCILTFFILAALQLTRQQGINLDLPQASTATVQMREMLVVTIDSTGQTFVDKQPVDRARLYQVLQTYQQQQPNGLLVLNASQTAFYNDVIQVLDILRSVGGDRVALATSPQTNSQPSPTLGTPGLTNPTPQLTPGVGNQASPGAVDLFGNPVSPVPENSQTPLNPTPVPTSQAPNSENLPTTVSPTPPQ